MSTLKVFELRWTSLGEKEWIAARTNLEAVKIYLQDGGCNYNDFSHTCELVELQDEQLDTNNIVNPDFNEDEEEDSENWEHKTFREAIAGRTKPFILAGTLGLGYE